MISIRMDSLETVWEGWLIKSPPSTRIWRAVTPRWRRRWFILRNSGELPGQYFLCYYTDRNCRKLKGQIDLDQCEQVDAGLRFENNKQRYQHMFTIKTPKRDYYLAAETEQEMNKWVDCICHVCGLKPFITEDTVTAVEFEGDNISQATTGITEISPPVTPHTIITGPYIPISECISGKPINNDEDWKQLLLQHGSNKTAISNGTPIMPVSIPTTVASVISDSQINSYDLPRNLRPPEVLMNTSSTPPPSPGSESVFTDDESVFHKHKSSSSSKKPLVNWETFPRPSDSSMDGEDSPSMVSSMSNPIIMRADRVFAKAPPTNPALILAPPRPPKPSHLAANESQLPYNPSKTEENVSIVTAPATVSPPSGPNTTPVISAQVAELSHDEMYDIPRSHLVAGDGNRDSLKKSAYNLSGPHCYTNAAPGHMTSDTNNVFRYDFAVTTTNSDEVPDSPRSETGSTSFTNSLTYSNLPSPSLSMGNNGQLIVTPPIVNRDLKPGLKWSDSTGGSNEPSPILMGYPRPLIDRNKKPLKPAQWKKIQETGRNPVTDVDGSIVLMSPPAGSLGRQKLRSGLDQVSSNNMTLKSHNSGFATISNMHRRHSSSDDRLAVVKDEMQVPQIKNSSFHPSSYRTESSKKFGEVQYLDLDLESIDNKITGPGLVKKPSENVHSPSTATVYKTVDFLKTEAFNRTRIEIEEERNRLCMAAESAL